MQLQLPMVVGKKVTEVEKEEKKEVETMKLRWDQSRYFVFIVFLTSIIIFPLCSIVFPSSNHISKEYNAV